MRKGRKLKGGGGRRSCARPYVQQLREGQRGRGHSVCDQRRFLEKETFKLGLKDRQDLDSKGEGGMEGGMSLHRRCSLA